MRRTISTTHGYTEEIGANKRFLDAIIEGENVINEIFKKAKNIFMTMDNIKTYEKSSQCWICERRFSETTIEKYATNVVT